MMNATFEELIDSFIARKVGFTDTFLSEQLVSGLTQNLLRLFHEGQMYAAGIGNNKVLDTQQKQRGDKIFWIQSDTQNEVEQEFLEQIAIFVRHLNRTCYTGINAFEFHYAIYEPGSCYKKHKDQFVTNKDRKFSLISYLNNDWLETDGGQLQIHQRGREVQRILPAGRSAVFFKSEELVHEVIPASRARLSVTGWLKQV